MGNLDDEEFKKLQRLVVDLKMEYKNKIIRKMKDKHSCTFAGVGMEHRYNESVATVKNLSVEKKKLEDDLIEARRTIDFLRHQNARAMFDIKELKQQAELHADIWLDLENFFAVQDKLERAVKDRNDAYALKMELEEEVEDLRSLNQVLMVSKNISNRELQDARNEAIMGLQGIVSDQSSVGIKIMGEIDVKPLIDICKKKYAATND